MPPPIISHRDALSRFDKAVAITDIKYQPTRPIALIDHGFEFQFRICPQLLRKPQLPAANTTANSTTSDILQLPSLHISTVVPAHVLVFNAYAALRPSFLLLTDSPEYRQNAPLSLRDITAARNALDGLSHYTSAENSDGNSEQSIDHIVIYNSGPASGCSRLHRHMQILPRPAFQLFPDRPTEKPTMVPYIYDLIRHPHSVSLHSENSNISRLIFDSYTASLERFRALLGIERNDEPVPHNLVMTREWTVLIPRRTAQVDGISANAAGMMGMVWVETEEKLEQWKNMGPSKVLGLLGLEAKQNHETNK